MQRLRRDAGGIFGLVRVLDEHWDAVEADFQRYYGLELAIESERAGLRRLAALTLNLPSESQTAIAQGGIGWDLRHEFAAKEIEVTADGLAAVFAALIALGGKKPPDLKPMRLPRPVDLKPKPAPTVEPGIDTDKMRRFFGAPQPGRR